VSVASAVPIAVADTASVRRAIDQVWQLPVTQAVVRCGDQRPTRAAASRSWRDSVGPLMPCGRRRPGPRRRGVGRSWSAPCRRAGDGSVPDPAKDVAEDARDGESMLRRTPFALENWSVR